MNNTIEPRVSVIMACRNEAGYIRNFLDGLVTQQTDGLAWEAIIADGLSGDSTRAVLDEYAARDPRIRVITNHGRIVSTGLNAAIAAARGEVIVRMDAHTDYAPDYLARCVEVLDRSGAQNVGGPQRTRASGRWGRAIAAAFHSPFASGGARFHDTNFEGCVDTVPYGCWQKSTLESLGLFDEELVRNQDDELNFRLTRSGGKIFQSASIVYWYHPRPTLSALFRQHMQYGFWKVAVIRKHRMVASIRHLVPGLFVASHGIFALGTMVALLTSKPHLAVMIAWLWAGMIGVYLLTALVAALRLAPRFGFDLVPLLPVVFATYHISYGAGFLAGLYRFTGRRENTASIDKAFVGLTR